MALNLNGVVYDWGGVEIDVGGKIITGGIGINYSHEIMLEILQAAGRNPYGRTDGFYKPGPTEYELYEAAYRDLITTLGPGYGMKEFNMSVNYAQVGGVNPSTDELIRCRIVKDAHSHKQGAGGLSVKVGISVFRYRIAGLDFVNLPGALR